MKLDLKIEFNYNNISKVLFTYKMNTSTSNSNPDGSSRKKWSIFKKLIVNNVVSTLAFFTITFLLFLGLILLNQMTLINDSRSALKKQTIKNLKAISGEKIRTYQTLMNQGIYGIIGVMSSSINYATRADYSFQPVSNYPDNNLADLAPPLVQIPRHGNGFISLVHSSFFIPGFLPDGSNIPALELLNQEILNQTGHSDFYTSSLYPTFKDFVAIYYGDQDSGMYRYYPGHSTKNVDPNRQYDPRARPWYTAATSSTTGLAISDPYLDAFGLGWMITISLETFDFQGQFIGVVGADMLISTIGLNLNNFQVKDSQTHLIQSSNGIVVSSPQWIPNLGDSQNFFYTNIDNPPLVNRWNQIKSSSQVGITKDLSFSGYVNIFTSIIIGDRTYILISTITEKSITEIVTKNEASLKEDYTTLIGIDVMISIIAIILIILLTWVFAHRATVPIRMTQRIFNKETSSVGCGDTERMEVQSATKGWFNSLFNASESENLMSEADQTAAFLQNQRQTAQQRNGMMINDLGSQLPQGLFSQMPPNVPVFRKDNVQYNQYWNDQLGRRNEVTPSAPPQPPNLIDPFWSSAV